MRIGIVTAGGDCPGINAAIRGVGKTAIVNYGMEVIGISSGFLGLVENRSVKLDEKSLSGILTMGGTILGTSREKPFRKKKKDILLSNQSDRIKKHFREMKIDCLVCIGGNGTMKTAARMKEEGLPVIGIPKTIDNDVWGTDRSFGFDSALNIATEALDRLHTTANSHRRIMVMEVMGHHAGWLALESGVAGGADVILIPEIPYDDKVIAEYILDRYKKEKPYSIVVVAEGIPYKTGMKNNSAAHYIATMISDRTGIETRETVLGYIQRGGIPTPADRILATEYGAYAVQCIAEGKTGRMVCLTGNAISSIPIEEAAGRLKCVPDNYFLLEQAQSMGTCFG